MIVSENIANQDGLSMEYLAQEPFLDLLLLIFVTLRRNVSKSDIAIAVK